IDGDGKITLSGGDSSRIVELVHSFEKASPTLTVQRLRFEKARTTDVPNTKETKSGGGAIYVLGGNLTVLDSTFDGNRGPDTGQDVAGGAIYVVGAGKATIARSTFLQNACSNGGAVGALGSALAIAKTSFSGNRAVGTGGNPGNGGNGGAIVMDGRGKELSLCGVVVKGSQANAFGGALFRTSYENEPTKIDQSVFDGNQIVDGDQGQAGALYLQGTHVTLTRSSIVNNKARFAAGVSVYEHGGPAPGRIDMINVTIARNTVHERPDFTKMGLVGGITVGDRVTGTWQNVSIVQNEAQFASGIGGGSTRLTITNSIVANVARNDYTPTNCNGEPAAGADNLQFPAQNKGNNDKPCVTGITKADPLMGALTTDPMPTVRPGAGSPALGAGKACPETDQLGKPRAKDGCTLGAVE
ncbi:MAG: hypothetical protein JNL38_15135, partial [Myxococcales bacterium]|nr:hypothetical protein [Myxococcales bacterium]